MEEECEMGRAATPLLTTRAHANAAATTRPIVADNPAERGRARQRRQRAERGAA